MIKKNVRQLFQKVVGLLLLVNLTLFLTSCGDEKEESKPEAKPADGFIETARSFVRLLEKRDFPRAVMSFDATMKSAMPKDKLEATWNAIIAQCGPFKKQGAAKEEKYEQYKIVFISCEFQKATLNAKVVLDKEKKVSGLFFLPK